MATKSKMLLLLVLAQFLLLSCKTTSSKTSLEPGSVAANDTGGCDAAAKAMQEELTGAMTALRLLGEQALQPVVGFTAGAVAAGTTASGEVKALNLGSGPTYNEVPSTQFTKDFRAGKARTSGGVGVDALVKKAATQIAAAAKKDPASFSQSAAEISDDLRSSEADTTQAALLAHRALVQAFSEISSNLAKTKGAAFAHLVNVMTAELLEYLKSKNDAKEGKDVVNAYKAAQNAGLGSTTDANAQNQIRGNLRMMLALAQATIRTKFGETPTGGELAGYSQSVSGGAKQNLAADLAGMEEAINTLVSTGASSADLKAIVTRIQTTLAPSSVTDAGPEVAALRDLWAEAKVTTNAAGPAVTFSKVPGNLPAIAECGTCVGMPQKAVSQAVLGTRGTTVVNPLNIHVPQGVGVRR